MFHVKHACLEQLVSAGLVGLDPASELRLARLADWLEREAVPGGGIGPNEAARLWPRHLCDSLAFALVVGPPPAHAADVGSGVGLPGLPLAILWPNTHWTLVERSGRKVQLARRAVQVLGLDNVTVTQAEHSQLSQRWPLVVSRATFPAASVAAELARLVAPGGQAVVALRRGLRAPPTPPAAPRTKLELNPVEVLDPPAWFLMIHPCD